MSTLTFRVCVLTLSGRVYYINTSLSATIQRVKELLEDAGGPHPEAQCLIYCGRECHNDQTLEAVGIQNNSTLHLVVVKAKQKKQDLKQRTRTVDKYDELKVIMLQRQARKVLYARLRSRLEEYQQHTKKFEAQVKQQQVNIEDLNDQLSDRDVQIRALCFALNAKQSESDSLALQLKKHQQHLAEHAAQVQTLCFELASKQKEISTLTLQSQQQHQELRHFHELYARVKTLSKEVEVVLQASHQPAP